ncbi:hypothetical protein H5410_041023 [Solanum commersonii]|uniref:Uncharacterized protein n=1 Tax=Solanum commersonii TaxID=4109 RepID=A0A9J5XRU9_SOLCO|nr:hypothetical protein H5410_041023 [Solanum commersonii]
MGLIEQGIIFKYLDFLTRIMQVEPKRDVTEALEVTSSEAYSPKGHIHQQIFQHLNICKVGKKSLDKGWISLQFLYDRYGREDGFKKFGRALNNKGSFETWKKHKRFVFMVALLGAMVFPRRNGKINILLTGVVNVLIEKKNYTIVPMILANIYRFMTVCQKGKSLFERCNILLQLWIVEHFYLPPMVARFIQDLSDYTTSHVERVEKYRCPEGVNARVLHQLGRRQVLPITEDMKDFVSEVGPEVPLPKGLAQKIWDGCLIKGIGTMAGDICKEPIDHEAEMNIKIELATRDYLAENQELRANLELARTALTQQQVGFEEERAKETQRETLLRGQVDLATIRGAQVAELAVSQQQQLRTCDQKIRHLADRTAQMDLDYQEMNHEQFLAEVPEFAEYLMTLVQDIYQSVGGRVRPPSP